MNNKGNKTTDCAAGQTATIRQAMRLNVHSSIPFYYLLLVICTADRIFSITVFVISFTIFKGTSTMVEVESKGRNEEDFLWNLNGKNDIKKKK